MTQQNTPTTNGRPQGKRPQGGKSHQGQRGPQNGGNQLARAPGTAVAGAAPRQGTLVPRIRRSNEAHLVENPDNVRKMFVQMDGTSNVAFLWHTVLIRTDAGTRLLDDVYDVLSRSLFKLSVIAQSTLVRLPVMMNALDTRLSRLIDDAYVKIGSELEKIKAECEEVGVELPHYHGVARVDMQIVNPKVLKLAQTIEAFDEMMARNDAIWIGGSGKRSDGDRVRYIRTWRNVMKKVTRTITLVTAQINRVMVRVNRGEQIDADADAQLESVDFLIDMVGSEDAMMRAIEGKQPRKKPQQKAKVREVSVEEHMGTRQKGLGESQLDTLSHA